MNKQIAMSQVIEAMTAASALRSRRCRRLGTRRAKYDTRLAIGNTIASKASRSSAMVASGTGAARRPATLSARPGKGRQSPGLRRPNYR